MKRHVGILVLGLLIVAALLMNTVCYQVDELRDVVIISTFGEFSEPIWGPKRGEAFKGRTEPGLHFKAPWPFQALIRYDARTFVFEDPYKQMQTRDEQAMLVTSYCAWRIRDPKQFYKAVKTVKRAREEISSRLQGRRNAVLKQHPMRDLINTDPAKMLLSEIEDEILVEIRKDVEDTFGIEVLATRIKVWGFPKSVNAKVIEVQKKERETEARRFKALGDAQAQTIRARAEAARDKITQFAMRKAAAIRSEGDRAAAEYYKKFEQNPELAQFLRTQEAMRKALKDNTTFWLDSANFAPVGFFQKGPSLDPFKAGAEPVKAGPQQQTKDAGKE